jgi:hypothetical protein
MKKIFLLFIIFTLFSNLSIYAINNEWKSGCIITIKGDTIHGLLAYQNEGNNWEKCLFKKSNSEIETTYTPNDIKGYKYDIGLCFESMNLNVYGKENKYFTECLLKGAISLYYLEINELKGFSSYYAVYAYNDKIIPFNPYGKRVLSTIEKERIRKYIDAIFDYNPQLRNDIENSDCSRSSISAIFKKYHDLVCTEYVCVSYQKPKHKHSYYVTPFIGAQLNNSHYNIDYNENRGCCNNYSPIIGVDFYMNVDKISDKLLFNIGLNTNQINIAKNKEPDLTKDYKAIQIVNNIGIQYRRMEYKTHPFIEGGVCQSLMFDTQNKTNAGKIQTETYHPGFYVGAGINIPMKVNNGISLKLKYSRYQKYNQELTNRTITLTAGYTFKLK